MSAKNLKLFPRHVPEHPDVWWYELKNGIEIHVDLTKFTGQTHLRFTIGWGIIGRALKRWLRK